MIFSKADLKLSVLQKRALLKHDLLNRLYNNNNNNNNIRTCILAVRVLCVAVAVSCLVLVIYTVTRLVKVCVEVVKPCHRKQPGRHEAEKSICNGQYYYHIRVLSNSIKDKKIIWVEILFKLMNYF